MKVAKKAMADTFAVLKPGLTVETVDLGPDFYPGLDRDFDGFRGHTLVSMHSFSETWSSWERHPAGDEIVPLMSGQVEFDLLLPNGVDSVRLTEPGDYIVVPKNTWHTARVSEPCRVLFITPGEGTQNDASPDGATPK